MRATRKGFVREALHPFEPNERTVRAVSAPLDFPVSKSFRRHRFTKAEAEESLKDVSLC